MTVKTMGRPKLYADRPVETKFTEEHIGAMERLAAQQGVTRSDVVREAVKDYIERNGK